MDLSGLLAVLVVAALLVLMYRPGPLARFDENHLHLNGRQQALIALLMVVAMAASYPLIVHAERIEPFIGFWIVVGAVMVLIARGGRRAHSVETPPSDR